MIDVAFFFFKQKTAYEMRISDWSSDVCSSDLIKKGIARGRLSRWPGNGDGKFNICKRRKRCLDFPCLPTCAMKSLRNTRLAFTGRKSGFNEVGKPIFSHPHDLP